MARKRPDEIEWDKVFDTQAGIIGFAEEAARILAEAGAGSSKAIGDDPHFAINQWSDVIRKRAHEILRERKIKPLPAPAIDGEIAE